MLTTPPTNFFSEVLMDDWYLRTHNMQSIMIWLLTINNIYVTFRFGLMVFLGFL